MIESPAWWGCAMFSLGFMTFPLGAGALHLGIRLWGMESGDDAERRLERAWGITAGFGVDVRRRLINPLWHERLDEHLGAFLDHLVDLDKQLHPSRDNPELCFHADVPHTANLPPDATLVLIHPHTDDADEIEADNALVTGSRSAPQQPQRHTE